MKKIKFLTLSLASLLFIGLVASCDKDENIQEATPLPPVQESEADTEEEPFNSAKAISLILDHIYSGGGNAAASYTFDQATLDYYIQETGFTGTANLADVQLILDEVLQAKQVGFANYIMNSTMSTYTKNLLIQIATSGPVSMAALNADPQYQALPQFEKDVIITDNNLMTDYQNGTIIIPGSRATGEEIALGIMAGGMIGNAFFGPLGGVIGGVVGGVASAIIK